MNEDAWMLFRSQIDSFTRRTLCLLGVLLVMSIGVLPGSLTVCLGAGDDACACCTEPPVTEQGCYSDHPAPVADTGATCCIELGDSPMPWLVSAPSVPLVVATVTPTRLPADDLLSGRHFLFAAPAVRPPSPVPLHIQFCCPLA